MIGWVGVLMESDWKSVIRKLERGNFIRDKLSRLDLRVCHYGKSSPEFLVGNAGKGHSLRALVGSGGKATTKRYILQYDFSSVGLVLLLAVLTIVLLILLYSLFIVVAKVDRNIVSSSGQLYNAGGQSMSTVFDRFGNSSIRPASITITQKIKCTARGLLMPQGTGECI